MDSEHRHELEENALATWLAGKIDAVKPKLPAIGVGAVLVIAGLIGLNGYRASAKAAEADRWRDFAVALEGVQPKADLLQKAVDDNPGTPVAEWAEVTWADRRLFEAANGFFRDRATSDEAVADAVEAYERLINAKDRAVSQRANFQLGRAYELQGKLEESREQYARVTGPFAEVARLRAEQLESKDIQEAYSWITATKNAPAKTDVEAALGDFEPDDIELPEVDAADADATLQDLLDTVEEEVNAADAEQAEEAAGTESAAADEEAAEEAAEAPAEE